jgi:hypothetical protein
MLTKMRIWLDTKPAYQSVKYAPLSKQKIVAICYSLLKTAGNEASLSLHFLQRSMHYDRKRYYDP